MKNIFFKTLLIINLFLISNCKAQTTSDYITFYNEVVPKFNTIAANKTQFYGQSFSNFYNELLNKNIHIVGIDYDITKEPSVKYNIIYLYFNDDNLWGVINSNSFRYPWVAVTFEDDLSSQIKTMVEQNHAQWNNNFVQFLSNKKIESIEFLGLNGYNSTDYSGK